MTATIKVVPTLQELRDAPELRPLSMEIQKAPPAFDEGLETLTQHLNEAARVMREGFEFMGVADPAGMKALLHVLRSPLYTNGMYLRNRRGRNRIVWPKRSAS
jgi:hypothetical protein